MKLKLTQLLKEELENMQSQQPRMNKNQKKEFLEMVSSFNKFNKKVYREQDIQELVSEMNDFVESVSGFTISETEDWFDKVTVSRHMKGLKEAYKVFEKSASTIAEEQRRMEAAYEDIAGYVQKYYKINEDGGEAGGGDIMGGDDMDYEEDPGEKYKPNFNDASVEGQVEDKNMYGRQDYGREPYMGARMRSIAKRQRKDQSIG